MKISFKEFLGLKPSQKRKIFYKFINNLKKNIRIKYFQKDKFKSLKSAELNLLKTSEFYVIILIIILGIAGTILSSLKFDEIPILINAGIYQNDAFWESFLINLHNTIFDYIIFSVILYLLFKKLEDRRRATDYYELIEDYRGWKREAEASIRVASYVKRLNKMGFYKYNLSNCSLFNANFENTNFLDTKFEGTLLKKTTLKNSVLLECIFEGNPAQDIKIISTDFKKCKLIKFMPKNGTISNAKFIECDFRNSIFNGTRLTSVNFDKCSLKGLKIENAYLENVNFKYALELNIEELYANNNTIKSCKFSDEMLRKIDMINGYHLEINESNQPKVVN